MSADVIPLLLAGALALGAGGLFVALAWGWHLMTTADLRERVAVLEAARWGRKGADDDE